MSGKDRHLQQFPESIKKKKKKPRVLLYILSSQPMNLEVENQDRWGIVAT